MKIFRAILPFALAWLVSLLLPVNSAGQTIRLSLLPSTNAVNSPDLVLVDSLVGTNHFTRVVAFSNLFNGNATFSGNILFSGSNTFNSLTLPASVFVAGGTGTVLYGPQDTNQSFDSTPTVSASPWSSGSFWTWQMKMTNANNGYVPVDPLGYWTYDLEAGSLGAVGWQSLEANLPGVNLFVGNGTEPFYAANAAGGTAGNIPWLAMDHGLSNSFNTDVYFPSSVDTTKHRPFGTFYKTVNNGVTNYTAFPSDGMSNTLVLHESTATTLVPTNATLNISGAIQFNSPYGGVTGTSPPVLPAYILSGSASTNGFWGATGPGLQGWAFDGSGATMVDGSASIFFAGNAVDVGGDGGINPAFVQNNVISLGASGQTWKRVWTGELDYSATNTAPVNAVTPVAWISLKVAGTSFKMPLYQ